MALACTRGRCHRYHPHNTRWSNRCVRLLPTRWTIHPPTGRHHPRGKRRTFHRIHAPPKRSDHVTERGHTKAFPCTRTETVPATPRRRHETDEKNDPGGVGRTVRTAPRAGRRIQPWIRAIARGHVQGRMRAQVRQNRTDAEGRRRRHRLERTGRRRTPAQRQQCFHRRTQDVQSMRTTPRSRRTKGS